MRDILCVDDESDNLIVFEATFEQDFRIWPASSGREALELLERRVFPVVVADQRMPQMTGTQLFEIMRRKHPHTKRIMLTGYADGEAMLSAINQGHVYNFIKKPWERSIVFPLLLRAIEAYDLEISNLALTDRLVTVDRCASLGQCAARIAHEMGNQLCMLPLLELIEEKYGHLDDLAQTAEFARHTYDRLVELINEVKSFVRQQHADTVFQPLLLTEALHELMDFLRYDATLPVQSVRLDLRADPTVQGNKTKLQQVLVNLLKNAAYAIQDRPEGRIVVSLDADAHQALLSVRDNGIGMTPEILQRIWEPFFTTKGDRGTGLGLDVSRSIIESHGGRIDCQSSPGCGATFTIFLPIVAAAPDPQGWPDASLGQPVFPASPSADNVPGEYPRT
jgi:response regulator RpfG family c-di-GMP phosphodiesterase